MCEHCTKVSLHAFLVASNLTFVSPSAIRALSLDIDESTRASDRTSVHTPTVRRLSPAEPLSLVIRPTTPAPSKKLQLQQQRPEHLAQSTMRSALGLTAALCTPTQVPLLQPRRLASEPCPCRLPATCSRCLSLGDITATLDSTALAGLFLPTCAPTSPRTAHARAPPPHRFPRTAPSAATAPGHDRPSPRTHRCTAEDRRPYWSRPRTTSRAAPRAASPAAVPISAAPDGKARRPGAWAARCRTARVTTCTRSRNSACRRTTCTIRTQACAGRTARSRPTHTRQKADSSRARSGQVRCEEAIASLFHRSLPSGFLLSLLPLDFPFDLGLPGVRIARVLRIDFFLLTVYTQFLPLPKERPAFLGFIHSSRRSSRDGLTIWADLAFALLVPSFVESCIFNANRQTGEVKPQGASGLRDSSLADNLSGHFSTHQHTPRILPTPVEDAWSQ